MNDFLIFENISKSFGPLRAVDRVSLNIARGEVFSLLGPSGCGKTTLLRLAAGFASPDSGRILLDGHDITALPPEKRPVNTVFQNYALFPHLNVADNIGFGLRIAGRGKSEIRRDVATMLDLVRLGDQSDKRPDQLSGGQKQRVAIARALINKPQVLLLDEPLAALDLKLRQHMLGELHKIHDEVGITFIYVTHDQTEAMGLSDRIAVMNEGHMEQLGAPVELYDHPASPFVARFIGDANFFNGTVVAAKADALYEIEVPGLGRITATSRVPLNVGASAELIVRPEQVNLHSVAPETGASNSLEAIIADSIYLGATTRWFMKSGETSIIAEQPHGLPKGSKCLVSFAAQDTLVLPARP
ncbi:MAG: ABC transporter ATP-binding protein [Verrucomicrobiaceae bacterium]